MQVIAFDTDGVPPADRLAAFRGGAPHFRVDALTADFAARWRLLRLGDVNLIRSWISPVRYRRDAAMIEADGEGRVTIHVRLTGMARGVIDGEQVEVGPGVASIWDLARPLDVSGDGDSELLIVTLPRHMLRELFAAGLPMGALAPSPALALAAGEAIRLLDRAEDLPDAGAPFYGRAMRDLFVAALLPLCRSSNRDLRSVGPLLLRIYALIDAEPAASLTARALAEALGVSLATLDRALARAGGLAPLVERRRLLAAYRLLSNPAETAAVSVIALRCGFADMPRFSRSFRSVFNTSASELRRHQRSHLPAWAGAYRVEQSYGALIAAEE